jgi:MFS family permease
MASPPPTTPFLGPRVAAIGFLVMTAAFGLNFAAGQFLAPLGREEGWSVAALSAAAALNTAVAGLVQPATGRLIDRVGGRPVIAVALALLAGAYVLLAVVAELWQFFLVYGLLAGIGFGSASSMAVSVLVSHWYTRRRATVLARVFMGINAGQLTLLPLGGLRIACAKLAPVTRSTGASAASPSGRWPTSPGRERSPSAAAGTTVSITASPSAR